ncbi:glycosyltransferase family 4 protein [Ruminococcus sp. 5_1_39BFAA]|uniref:glycosyltransferase family 4 protein n=1 Tax=Ruminococcus sp. 5_1_39BFAA TaxID=457412 RepID=UPI0035678867
MRIGIDARPLVAENPSGIGNYVINILKYCSNSQDREFVLYSNEPLLYHNEIIKKFEIKIVPGSIGTTWVCYGLRKALQKDKIDVFWGTQHMIPLNCGNIRLILTVHDLALMINPSWGSTKNAIMQNIFGKMSVRKADCIIADSVSTANDVKRIIKWKGKEIYPILLGGGQIHGNCTKGQIEIISEKYNIAPYDYYLYIGTIEPRKNISGIVRAYNIYRKSGGMKKLIIAGGLGWKYKNILREITSSPFKNDIILPGYVSEEEKDVFIKNTTAFLFPSNYEGFGFPVLEAMSYGVPVITTSVSSLPEVGGELAFYTDAPNDWKGISELMFRIETMSSHERQALSIAEKEWYSKFKWERCAMETLDLLK